ncbi:MAG: immunoglobulin domain-containing protein, partial [Akkermansiaceae bacterium]|nr:immunoglobulin domain-containing protein [Verrucomicrobiales bacterium]
MKQFFPTLCLSAAFAFSTHAIILLDDSWSDGTRTDQNLPAESAWFASTGAALTASPGAMTLAMGGSAILGVTYFASNSTSPIRLAVGDTFSASITLIFNGVSPVSATTGGFRLGLYNFADSVLSPRWAAVDGFSNSSQGGGVHGYTLFQTLGVTFSDSNPMDIRVRTNLTSGSLLSSSGDHKTLLKGPGNTSGFSGFTNGIPYRLQLSLQRSSVSAMVITATWFNLSNGASLSTSVIDTNATNFRFDGIALRPQNAVSSSTNIVFQKVKVELTSAGTEPSIHTGPADQTVFVDQSATFLVDASGATPLSYFWYHNTNTLVTNAKVPSLTLPNVQLAAAGEYFVVVSNSFGSVTSVVATLTVLTPTAPSIVTEPQSVTVPTGDPGSFQVIAGGSEPLTYQWLFNTNTPLPNATDPMLTVGSVQVTNAGVYNVIVSNLAGSVTSAYAVLAISTNPVAPVFTSQPASQTVLLGGIANFS